MSIIKCKMCGGELAFEEGASTARCDYCGMIQTIPLLDDEKKLVRFERAERLRKQCEFDKAAGIYETIVADFRQEAEAYWGLVLCKYGIEYVDDPTTGKKIPTCHRTAFDSIMDDPDFEQVMENADPVARKVYREEAKTIEEIRKGIISVSATEQPYDIFICYKEVGLNGERTLDSVLAQDIYNQLTARGYRVFFSRITLEDKLGMEYEPYIFAALNSAKIMLVFGTDYEYFNAVWVKNEWSRYLKLMSKDKKKHLIPCFKGIDAYDMPKEFARFQSQDLGKVGADQDLLRGIEKLLTRQTEIAPAEDSPIINTANLTVNSYLKRVFMFLEDQDWKNANKYSEKVLDIDPENARAYLGKLLATLRLKNEALLAKQENAFDENDNYQKALRFADDVLRIELKGYEQTAKKHMEEIRVAREKKAKEEIQQKFTIENGCLVQYKARETNVNIPEGIIGIGNRAFDGNKMLTSVSIPEGVEYIGYYAFNWCSGLTAVTIPSSVTSIGKRAFAGCSFTTVTIPSCVRTIGDEAFYCCCELVSVEIPASVTSIGNGAFALCRIGSVMIPEGVPRIGDYAFYRCTALTSVTIPYTVTVIGKYAFSDCKALKSVFLPSGVIAIGDRAFSQCTALTDVTIPDSVTNISEDAFLDCPNVVILTPYKSFAWMWAKRKNINVMEDRRSRDIRMEGLRRAGRGSVHDFMRQGLCQYCGGELKGLIGRKCELCGKMKDYYYF